MGNYMLVALDAKTGRQVASFGKNGVVDMVENLRWNERPGLPRDGRVANTSPPAIVGNVLVSSISMHTGSTPNLPGASINEQWPMNIPGDVVAYDTKTGKMLWRFNIIPRPGEEGSEKLAHGGHARVWDVPGGLNAWAKDHPELREKSNRYTGNAGFWAPATADPELGMFYIPAEVADQRLLWRLPPRQQPLRQFGDCTQREDGQASVAFPNDAPRYLGLRPADRADSRGHHRRWPSREGSDPADQAGICLRVGP